FYLVFSLSRATQVVRVVRNGFPFPSRRGVCAMRRCVAITALLIVTAWLVPAFSADEAKKDDAKKDGSAKESISKKDSKEVKSSRKAPTKEKNRSDIVVGKLT